MKALSIAHKTFRELWREPVLLGILFAFPIGLLLLYDLAFGQAAGLGEVLKVLVINHDSGPLGTVLIDSLEAYEIEGEPVFEVTIVDGHEEAEIAVRERKASLLLEIPPDFSTSSNIEIILTGDQSSGNYVFGRSFLDGLLRPFSLEATEQQSQINVSYEFLPHTDTISDFEFGVGGTVVFGIMFLTMSTAMVMVREQVSGTWRRLRLSRVRGSDMILGVLVAMMVLAVILVPLMFGVAIWLGFESHGSLLLAMGVALLLSIAAVGMGLVVACFVRTDSEAANIGAGVVVPMVLLSGALYPLGDASIVTVRGRAIQAFDIFPTAHAAEALRQILVEGAGIADLTYELACLTLLSIAIMVMGSTLYRRLQK